jgi:hypothetical protein
MAYNYLGKEPVSYLFTLLLVFTDFLKHRKSQHCPPPAFQYRTDFTERCTCSSQAIGNQLAFRNYTLLFRRPYRLERLAGKNKELFS